MITFTNIRNVTYSDYDEVWAIMRYIKANKNYVQVQELAPSYQLFSDYRRLVADNEWNKVTFDHVYVPRFLRSMCARESRNKLNELFQKDKQGIRICAFCTCIEEEFCHRSIVAGLLQGVGADVRGVKKDYSEYYRIWKELPGR